MSDPKKKNTHVKPWHPFYFWISRIIAAVFSIKTHFKLTKYRLDKHEPCLILSNHQASLDPVFLARSFNRPIYFVSSDHIFHKGFISKILVHAFAPIPRHKGELDIKFIMEMMKVAKEGGNIAIFIEGNRTWTNSFVPTGMNIVKLIRKLNISLILFNLHGGFGVDPRFGKKVRRGKFTGTVRYHLKPDQIKEMSDDDLLALINQALSVTDGSDGELFKSKDRAEYLERMMFTCPYCRTKHTLRSEGAYVHCSSCGGSIEYGEDLKLHYQDGSAHSLLEYYNMQIGEIKNDVISENQTVLEDEGITLYDQTSGKRKEVCQGKITMTDRAVVFDGLSIPFEKITGSSVIGGSFITIDADGKNYIVIGNERFSALKYELYFAKLVPSLRDRKDNYYGLNVL